jgi:hypothetical protein
MPEGPALVARVARLTCSGDIPAGWPNLVPLRRDDVIAEVPPPP